VTTALLDVMGVEHAVLAKDQAQAAVQIETAVARMRTTGQSYALVVEKDTFEPYAQTSATEASQFPMSREEAIQAVAAAVGENDVIVSTTGMISRELFEYRVSKGQGHGQDFLTVGSMGHASQIALGIALEKPDRRVWCFDGDGAAIMHMGSLAIVADKAPENFIHVVFNNGAHDSVGGQPTVGLKIDLPAVARAVGYRSVCTVADRNGLEAIICKAGKQEGPAFIEIKVRKGNRKDLGRPTTTPVQNKTALMDFLKG
jgi:phosphonopyruvate decarboxylase